MISKYLTSFNVYATDLFMQTQSERRLNIQVTSSITRIEQRALDFSNK